MAFSSSAQYFPSISFCSERISRSLGKKPFSTFLYCLLRSISGMFMLIRLSESVEIEYVAQAACAG